MKTKRNNLQNLFMLLFVFSIMSCKTIGKLHPNDTIKTESQLKFYRGACYGQCPVFSITIKENGSFSYLGKMWVAHKGSFKGNLSDEQTINLFKKLNSLQWEIYEDEYPLDNSDFPSFSLEYSNGTFVKTIRGNTNAPQEIQDLSKMLDRLLTTLTFEAL